MCILKYIFFLFFLSSKSIAFTQGSFSGRIVGVNPGMKTIRIKIDFLNYKYLKRGDGVTFAHRKNLSPHCKGTLLARTDSYFLIKIIKYSRCTLLLSLVEGYYLFFYSDDLEQSLKVGEELLKILLKKRMVLLGRWLYTKRGLDKYVEEINIINKKFIILRSELTGRWNKEIDLLERDRQKYAKDHSENDWLLSEIDKKIADYSIEDYNLKLDRWSLDKFLYYRK